MQITVLQENLKQQLNYLQKVIPSKPQLPILSSILLQVKGDQLTLSATDLYLGIKTSLLAEVKAEGSLVVSGDIFRNLINSLLPGKIGLTLDQGSLIIVQGQSKTKLACQPADEYPTFPDVEGEEVNLNTQVLSQIEQLVSFAVSSDQTRPVLTSLLFKFRSKGLELVATDGFRLAKLQLDKLDFAFEQDLLIPARALNELSRIAQQTQSDKFTFVLSEQLKQVLFKVGQVELSVRLMDGDYPPYQKIIPPEFKLILELDTQEFINQLKRAQIFAREVSNIVNLEFEQSASVLTITALSPAFGEYKGEMPVKLQSNDLELESKKLKIAFNVNYLIEFINAIQEETLWLQINESLKPAALSSTVYPNYLYIIMPFRVNE